MLQSYVGDNAEGAACIGDADVERVRAALPDASLLLICLLASLLVCLFACLFAYLLVFLFLLNVAPTRQLHQSNIASSYHLVKIHSKLKFFLNLF